MASKRAWWVGLPLAGAAVLGWMLHAGEAAEKVTVWLSESEHVRDFAKHLLPAYAVERLVRVSDWLVHPHQSPGGESEGIQKPPHNTTVTVITPHPPAATKDTPPPVLDAPILPPSSKGRFDYELKEIEKLNLIHHSRNVTIIETPSTASAAPTLAPLAAPTFPAMGIAWNNMSEASVSRGATIKNAQQNARDACDQNYGQCEIVVVAVPPGAFGCIAIARRSDNNLLYAHRTENNVLYDGHTTATTSAVLAGQAVLQDCKQRGGGDTCKVVYEGCNY